MTFNANATKAEVKKTELSEQELAQASGGFNPQPDTPGVVAKPSDGIKVPQIRAGIKVPE